MSEPGKYSKKNPFIAPDGYFKQLPDRIKQKLESENGKTDNKWKIISFKPYITVAAGFLLVFTLWFILLNQLEKKEVATDKPKNENPENLYFESMNSNELIELIVSNEIQEGIDLQGFSTDTELILEQIEESEIIDAI